MGHVHLKVASIPETVAFYRDGLGFGLMAQLGAHAAFLGAGGYHHHIGANIWESAARGRRRRTAPRRCAGRRSCSPTSAEREELLGRLDAEVGETAAGPVVRDPSGNALLLALA